MEKWIESKLSSLFLIAWGEIYPNIVGIVTLFDQVSLYTLFVDTETLIFSISIHFWSCKMKFTLIVPIGDPLPFLLQVPIPLPFSLPLLPLHVSYILSLYLHPFHIYGIISCSIYIFLNFSTMK